MISSNDLLHYLNVYSLQNFHITKESKNQLFNDEKYKTSKLITLDDDNSTPIYSVKCSYKDFTMYITSMFYDDNYYMLLSYEYEDKMPCLMVYWNKENNVSMSLTRLPDVLYWLPSTLEQMCLNVSAFESMRNIQLDLSINKNPESVYNIFVSALKELNEGQDI